MTGIETGLALSLIVAACLLLVAQALAGHMEGRDE